MKSADFERKLGTLRAKIAEAKAERARIEELPVPRALAEQRIGEHLDELAGRWRVETGAYTFPSFEQPALVGKAFSTGRSGIALTSVEVALAALFPELLRQRLIADLDETYAAGDGITDAERRATIDMLDRKLFELEVAEEQVIADAEANDVYIARRPDANAHAIIEAAA